MLPDYHRDYEDASTISSLRIDADGVANVIFDAEQTNYLFACAPDLENINTRAVQLRLYRIASTGSYTVVPLYDNTFDLTRNDVFDPGIQQRSVLPDGQGGTLVAWEACLDRSSTSANCDMRGRYLTGTSTGTEMELPGLPIVSASHQTAYSVDSAAGTKKFNMMTGQLSCASAVTGVSGVALAGDRVAISGPSGTTILGSDCSTVTAGQPALGNGLDPYFGDSYSSWSPLEFGGDTWFGNANAVSAEDAYVDHDAGYSSSIGGNPWGTAAAIPEGRGIFAKGHEAAGITGFYHVSLRIVPANQDRWLHPIIGDPLCPDGSGGSCFVNKDEDKNYFVTIGAGSSIDLCGGSLVSGLNRGSDVTRPAADPPERLNYPKSSEDRLISQLFSLYKNYQNDLPYACFPQPLDQYFNSNSYAAGLLNSAKIPKPAFPTAGGEHPYPGWLKPVPSGSFVPR